MSGFSLGIEQAITALTCYGPALISLLLAEGRSVRGSAGLLVLFLGARLAGFLLWGASAGRVGEWVLAASPAAQAAFGALSIVTGALLLAYAVFLAPASFDDPRRNGHGGRLAPGSRLRLAGLVLAGAGFLSALEPCPALLATLEAAGGLAVAQSLLFFALFFVGTALPALLLALIGLFHRNPRLKVTGRTAAGLVGMYYIFTGILFLLGLG